MITADYRQVGVSPDLGRKGVEEGKGKKESGRGRGGSPGDGLWWTSSICDLPPSITIFNLHLCLEIITIGKSSKNRERRRKPCAKRSSYTPGIAKRRFSRKMDENPLGRYAPGHASTWGDAPGTLKISGDLASSARYAPTPRLVWGDAPGARKSGKRLKKSRFHPNLNLYPSYRRFPLPNAQNLIFHHPNSILKGFKCSDRTTERFCKSRLSFYPQNSVRTGNGSF
ncbi:hypothetical protein E3N88_00624 [Mikania micrantha]|uniref:Uncharacterized protein n=1 Tax=Mikania micrantha TaxID=192012 RepID=A0A5N6Q0X6_9ASTR|nr:hypothetical protein E3N88_00624 [Mikania micrantha]